MQQTPNALFEPFRDMGRSWAIVRRDFRSIGGRSGFPANASPFERTRLDALDTFVFLPCIWVAAALGFTIANYPVLFLVTPPLFLAYAIVRRIMPPRLLAAYVVLCLAAGALSKYHAFPRSWQVVFLAQAIPRQLAPIISFLCVGWAAKAYFLRRIQAHDVFAAGRPIIILGYIVAPLLMFHGGVRYQLDDASSSTLASYGAFINNITLGLFFLFGHLYCSSGARRYAAAAVILLIAATTHFIQFKVIALAAVIMLIGFPPRMTILAVVAAFVAIYGLQALDVPGAIARNPNKGIRIAFIVDSFQSLVDTSGFGIGYGTESVRWVYRYPGLPDFTFMPNPATLSRSRLLELLSRGVHNSFAQAMLRTGIAGWLLLTCAMFRAFPPRGLPRPVLRHASIMFIVVFVACFVNPALESARQLIGVGFSYGYLLALRSSAKRRPGSSMPALTGPGDGRSTMRTEAG